MVALKSTKKKATAKAKAAPARGADKKEAFHREAESRMTPFKFERPRNLAPGVKATYFLARSDISQATIQVVPEGGDNNLHYHPGDDGFWMVLEGKVKFYGPDGVVGVYGPNEGILVPRNSRYWFETADKKEELVILHVSSKTQQKVKNTRVNVEPANEGYKNAVRLNFPKGTEPKKTLD
jgi:mannose-6-phosphate isomerase-like protein (cupin superfamily)